MGRAKEAMDGARRRLKGAEAAGLAASIELIDPSPELEFAYGDITEVHVRVGNLGSEEWDTHRPGNPDLLSYHWETAKGESVDRDGLRTTLPAPVRPGGFATVRLRVSVSTSVENAVLSVDMVREGEAWFSQKGSTPLRIPCRIAAAPEEAAREIPVTTTPRNGEASSVEQLWGEKAGVRKTGQILGWLDHPVVLQECILPKLETPGTNWVSILVEKHGVERGGHWLSLGCGDGNLELWLTERGSPDPLEGVDVSEGAVEIANCSASERGMDKVRFRSMDLNTGSLPESSYDVILASMSVHHVSELEAAFGGIYRALRPGGFLLANEFVGPSRMQFTDGQIALANKLIALLPGELRVDTVSTGVRGTTIFKDRYKFRAVEEWLELDPSEAVRSAEMVGIFEKTFSENTVYRYGGALLHLALEHIADNFDPDDPRERALLRVIDLMETELTASGELDSDFAMLVGRKPTWCPVP